MSDETILVTGASGFIGYALTGLLARQGRRVVGYDLVGLADEDKNCKTIDGDLNDIHRLHKLFKEEKITSVIHCGAISGPMLALDNPYSICLTNIMGTANLLELSRIYGVDRFVYCSSGSAYGENSFSFFDEEVALHPKDVYGATKASGEHLVEAFAAQHGVNGVSLRISWVYGPRRRTNCLIREMIKDALANRTTKQNWGLDSYRQYTYVEDVAAALIAALDRRSLPRSVYNVAGESSYVTIGQVAEAVKCVLPNADIQLGHGIDPDDSPRGEFDISAAKQDLGFFPSFSLVQGIEAYHEWLLKQRSSQ